MLKIINTLLLAALSFSTLAFGSIEDPALYTLPTRENQAAFIVSPVSNPSWSSQDLSSKSKTLIKSREFYSFSWFSSISDLYPKAGEYNFGQIVLSKKGLNKFANDPQALFEFLKLNYPDHVVFSTVYSAEELSLNEDIKSRLNADWALVVTRRDEKLLNLKNHEISEMATLVRKNNVVYVVSFRTISVTPSGDASIVDFFDLLVDSVGID